MIGVVGDHSLSFNSTSGKGNQSMFLMRCILIVMVLADMTATRGGEAREKMRRGWTMETGWRDSATTEDTRTCKQWARVSRILKDNCVQVPRASLIFHAII